jgi:hypothetical protein
MVDADVVLVGSDEDDVARDRDEAAEAVAAAAVGGGELLLFDPHAIHAAEDVRRAAVGTAIVGRPGTHDDQITRDCDEVAKVVAVSPIGGHELPLLEPRPADTAIHVGRAAPNAVVVVVGGPDYGDLARDRYGAPELVVIRPVAGYQLLLEGLGADQRWAEGEDRGKKQTMTNER